MTIRPISANAPLAAASPGTPWQGFIARLLAAARVVGTRRTLLEMDARMLQDVGITHAQAVEEARRMPWDLGPVRGRR
jgi:uncharacterized protein YjiS (DUF1127 family)